MLLLMLMLLLHPQFLAWVSRGFAAAKGAVRDRAAANAAARVATLTAAGVLCAVLKPEQLGR